MRPQRLELEGFTVFRQPVTVDFEGTDLFALTGPTGVGKTSLIDAVTFALYGAVPRLDRRAVAPIVSQNLTEARVRLDFTVGDDTFTAVRVVRATKTGGATTKEARLERVVPPAGDGEAGALTTVLAGNADEVTSAVTELLGLTYEHFTTCVSLPQGQFARFLHDKPRDRQDLLVRLLGLGVYDQVAGAARQRAALAKETADVMEGRLAQLAGATAEARSEATARVEALAGLAESLAEAKPRLEELAAQVEETRREADELEGRLRLLDGIAPPDDVAELAEMLAGVGQERAQLAHAEQAASEELASAEAELADQPLRARLEAHKQDLQRREELTALVEKGRLAAEESATAVADTAESVTAAEAADTAAVAALERVRVEQRAQALVPALVSGEPCPVCRQPVHDVPAISAPEVTDAERLVAEAGKRVKEANRNHSDARTHQARVDEKLERVEREQAEVSERLSQMPTEGGLPQDLASVEAALEQVTRCEHRVEDARQADRAARKGLAAVQARHEQLERKEADSWRAFDASRDRLAVFEPPASERRNLAEDWAALVAWAAEQRPAVAEEVARLRGRADEVRQEHSRIWHELASLCRSSQVEPRPAATGSDNEKGEAVASVDLLTEPVAVERARAEDRVQRIDVDLAEAERLRGEQGKATEQRQVAETLAVHLKANRFEKWLLDEAVVSLAASASQILGELSGGTYALSVDSRSGGFTVIDHVNASQPRSARTLSGGETFLASLALALGLAEQVAELAAGGTARLEALFLDEGFGTLDADTLDVVATALDELGARGRMVGIVTHVRDLAERLPVRYEVRKVGANATVERVEA